MEKASWSCGSGLAGLTKDTAEVWGKERWCQKPSWERNKERGKNAKKKWDQSSDTVTTQAFKLWCRSLESPLNSKEIKPVNPRGNQPGIFIGRTDAEAKVPILWQPDGKSQLIGKDPNTGKD